MSTGIGFPQLDFSTYPSQIFWLVVTFTTMYTIMAGVALPRVGKVLAHRKALRDQDLLDAEQLGDTAEKLRIEYDTAMLAARRQSAETIAAMETDITKEAARKQEELSNTLRLRLEKAEAEIARAREAALKDIENLSADIASEITRKVANLNTNSTESQKAVTAARKVQGA